MWLAFLTRHELLDKDKLPAELNDASLQKALTVLNVMNFSYEEKEAYEDHLKWLRIEANTLQKYEQKGREEGREEGLVEGLAEGQVKAKIEMAKKMLIRGKSIDEIAELTELSKSAIELLKHS